MWVLSGQGVKEVANYSVKPTHKFFLIKYSPYARPLAKVLAKIVLRLNFFGFMLAYFWLNGF